MKSIEDTYQVSPMQHGMLFHSLYTKHSGVDIEQMVCTLYEDLNVPAFKQAWERVVARYSSLRTSFRWEGLDKPLQDVHRNVKLPLDLHDWRDLTAIEQENLLKAYLQADRQRGFELTEVPLTRLALFQLDQAGYQFIWTFHHILMDGRSHLLILKEAFAFYEAFCQGQDLQLEHSCPYRDHIEWLQQQDLSKAEVFWQQTLKGFTAPTPLIVAQASDSLLDQEQDHGEQEIRLSGEVTSALQCLAQQHQLTLNTMVQGAWALLLSRYSGEKDVVFGATRAGRRSTVAGAEAMVGMFINTLPVRVRVSPDMLLLPWLKELRAQQIMGREYEHTPLVEIQRWSDVPAGMPLFETILVFENYLLNSALRAQGGSWEKREFRLLEKTNYPLTVYGYAEPALLLKIAYDRHRFDDATIARLLGHIKTLLEGMAANPNQCLATLPLLTEVERYQLLVEWNDTQVDYPKNLCIHHLFEAQVKRTPDAVAIVFEDQQLTYRQLNTRSNQLGHYLRKLNVGPETRVGIYMERSLDMIVGLLGILKAGGAYLPLDPVYPAERIAFMIEDARVPVLVTQAQLVEQLPPHHAQVVQVNTDWDTIAAESMANINSGVTSANLSYVIYTSGSAGKPKSVMIEHNNVVNFFTGMDDHIPHDPPGVWLAVTSLSFDISVLELLWTLARGFKVVIYADKTREQVTAVPVGPHANKEIQFSLFYFASDEREQGVTDKYKLLLEGAKFADKHDFATVWTPERHFHAFGGLYPNPSVASAAIAAITEHIGIRAGSCVLPLHNPIRVTEEWSLVDNISKGRVGISFASGWQPNDFVLKPENFANSKEVMFRDIEVVRKLWRGETVPFPGPNGKDVEVRTLPRPVQAELPVWITAAGNPDTFRLAGAGGFNILTHLLGQTVEDLAGKLAIYRQAWVENGHPGKGHVTLMLHTFVGDEIDEVHEVVRKPLTDYLRSSVGLIKEAAWSFPAFKQRAATTDKNPSEIFESGTLTHEDMEALLAHAFERYFEMSGLFGTPSSCLKMVNKLKAIEVGEIACLIDFGVRSDLVLQHLNHLNALKELATLPKGTEDYTIPAQIERHHITHFQCTPSLASMLIDEKETRAALSRLRVFLLGGEALPLPLATELKEFVSGNIINMYGPTETTIWSSTYLVEGVQNTIPIGRPIANTEMYILDNNLQPVPIGVIGELFIGGDGVARGYLDRPELTAERFIKHPFSDKSGVRVYRTGDLARYRPDGNIEFLGRIDQQIKIRGYRIELGEIETVLAQHPDVQKSVVIVTEDTPGEKRLVAYLITSKHSPPSHSELRNFLKEKLPEYMVPSTFMFLDALPLTPNGKVDRQALPPPDQARPELERAFVGPQDTLELQLTQIWEEVLGIHPIGVNDNFFELGGHSLLAVSLFAQIEKIYGKNLPLVTLFQGPTIAQLANILHNEGWSVSWSSLVPIQPAGFKPPFFCVHAHGGNVVGYHDLARHLGSDQPFYGLQAQGLSGKQVDIPRFEDMAAHYIEEIRTVQPRGPYFLGGYCLGGDLAFEMAQQLQAQGEEVALLAMIQNAHPDYPKFLPNTTLLHRLIYRLVARIDLELSNFLEVKSEAKLSYLSERAKRVMVVVQVKTEKMIESFLAKFHLGLAHSQLYTLEVLAKAYEKAYANYEPRPYKGQVILFRASKQPLGIYSDPTLGWGQLIKGELELLEIPGHHIGLLSEPRVRILAERLRTCLSKAQNRSRQADEWGR